MANKKTKNVQMVLDILRDEVNGNVEAALEKVTSNYSMTWIYKKGKTIFPTTTKNTIKELNDVYPIKGRQYDIKHVAEGVGVVMVELVESYPDPKTKKIYRTPLVLVLEIKQGKIETGRHYCDPALSYLYLTERSIDRAYKGVKTKKIKIK